MNPAISTRLSRSGVFFCSLPMMNLLVHYDFVDDFLTM
jgi:hypothetical protein